MSTPTNSPDTPKPLAELRDYVSRFTARCRAAKWFGALFHVRVVSDIVQDVEAEQKKIAREAYSAEQADLEAAKLIEAAAKDGFSNSDIPALAEAVRLIRSSARGDRNIAEGNGVKALIAVAIFCAFLVALAGLSIWRAATGRPQPYDIEED